MHIRFKEPLLCTDLPPVLLRPPPSCPWPSLLFWPTLWSLPRTPGLPPWTWPPEKVFPTLVLILNMASSMKLLYSLTHSCLYVSSMWWWFPLCWLCAGLGESAGMVGDMFRKAGRGKISGWRSWEEWKGDGLCWEVTGRLWTGTWVTPMVSGPLWLLQEGSLGHWGPYRGPSKGLLHSPRKGDGALTREEVGMEQLQGA